MTDQPPVSPTQADRDAAYALLIGPRVAGGDGNTFTLRTPNLDQAANAFARHRLSAIAPGGMDRDWVLVPREPTPEMIRAGAKGRQNGSMATAMDMWSYMLASVPLTPQSPGGEAKLREALMASRQWHATALAAFAVHPERIVVNEFKAEIERIDAALSTVSAPDITDIPAGMKPWAGGDRAPDDWDGGDVLWYDGVLTGAHKDAFGWKNGIRFGITAYTPKAAAPVATERLRAIRVLALTAGLDPSHTNDAEEWLGTLYRDDEVGLDIALRAIERALAEPAPVGDGRAERRQCSICTAIVASYPEGMCCHCRELPWPLAQVDGEGSK